MKDHKQSSQATPLLGEWRPMLMKISISRCYSQMEKSSNAGGSTRRTNYSLSHIRWYIPHIFEGGSYHKLYSLDQPQTLICMESQPTRYVVPSHTI